LGRPKAKLLSPAGRLTLFSIRRGLGRLLSWKTLPYIFSPNLAKVDSARLLHLTRPQHPTHDLIRQDRSQTEPFGSSSRSPPALQVGRTDHGRPKLSAQGDGVQPGTSPVYGDDLGIRFELCNYGRSVRYEYEYVASVLWNDLSNAN
jgi:hypothetical protein